MLLIDAIYIHEGGTKILLDYLVDELEKTDLQVFYLLDSRIKNKETIKIKSTNTLVFENSSFLKRVLFYKKYSSLFSTVFCFANIPPPFLLSCRVITYFHQALFLQREFNIMFYLKKQILLLLKKKTSQWILQSEYIKNDFALNLNISIDLIDVIPFYPPITSKGSEIREKGRYIYVSNAYPHKNHKNLIEAFCEFYKKNKKGKLILTISNDNYETISLIKQKRNEGYPIENLGFIDRSLLMSEYLKSEFAIFPSLVESFGLGIVESIECGCKLIASDFPYVYAICKPSLTFDPLFTISIENALELTLNADLPNSELLASNKIEKLLHLLKDKNK